MGACCSSPERSASHDSQWSHQLPWCGVASSFQASGSGGGAPGRVRYIDFLLPGGLTMAWMWPLELSTNSLLPPSSWVVWYAPFHGTMWSVAPATTYASQ